MAEEVSIGIDNNRGTIRTIDIEQEMRGAYLDYAMSVIVARALPNARDGLKPVQRRILYAMHDMGVRSNTPYKKSARIVGEVLGKYHPHSDTAVYDAMARMAQDFSMRYMLVDGQGNFGSVDGDAPAAMRYTEARLSRLAEELLADINKETVDWSENFDGSLKEPTVLPSVIPNLLLNGSSGIAVGMATNIPPHNLNELLDAIEFLIKRWQKIIAVRREAAIAAKKDFARDEELATLNEMFHGGDDDVTVDNLMEFVHGPDFPTGAMILGREGIINAYATGKGRIVMRAVAKIEEMKGRRFRILVTEIPYQVNKSALIERMAHLVRNGRIKEISDIRDESDRNGMSIVIELKRGSQPKTVLNKLYKFTALQSTFGVQLLALVDGQPRLLSLKRALQLFIEHRHVVVTRRTEFDLKKARRRAHILEGLRIALANLDAVIKTIRESPNADAARERLMKRFKLSDIQAQAILDLQLRRLAALERQKIEDEYQEVMQTIAYLEDLLANPHKILSLILGDCAELAEKYGDARRTHIAAGATEEMSIEDLVADERVLVQLTERGYIKRLPVQTFRKQARGGRGVTGIQTREEDVVLHIFATRTLHHVLFFSDEGKVYHIRAFEVPNADRTAKGVPLANLISIGANERITAAVSVPDFSKAAYFMMCTRNGRIKRVEAEEFEAVRPSGIIAMSLKNDDVLGWVKVTRPGQDIIIVTEQGKALRYNSKLVRPMGRTAAGVKAIRLAKGDYVVSMDAVRHNQELLVVTSKGYGKRTPLNQYSTKGRATGGIRTLANRIKDTGIIAAARVVKDDDEITIITSGGIALRTAVANVAVLGRATRGVRVIRLQPGHEVASLARIESDESEIVVDGTNDVQANGKTAQVTGENGKQPAAEVSE